HDLYGIRIRWQRHDGLVDLVVQRLTEDVDAKPVAHHKLIQIGKQPRRGQARMRGENRVRACTAYWQRGAGHMPDTFLQHVFADAMVDRQLNIDCRYFQRSHNAVSGKVEKLIIGAQFYLVCGLYTQQGLVVELRSLQLLLDLRVFHRADLIGILCLHSGLLSTREVIAEYRIQNQSEPDEREQHKSCACKDFFTSRFYHLP